MGDEQTIRMIRASASSGDKRKDRGARETHALSSKERKRLKGKAKKKAASEAAEAPVTNAGVNE